MTRYIARRVLWSVPVLFALILFVFLLMRALPGGPFDFAGDRTLPEAVMRNLQARYHLDEPLALQSIDVRGPTSLGAHWGAYAPRGKKADVTVEVSADGATWRRAGELKGISADADFLPVDLGGATVKAVRLSGTVWPYREAYHPVQVQGDQFWRHEPHYNPSFWWRFVSPEHGATP